MAIIMQGHSRCAICGSTDLSKPFIGTTGAPYPRGDELWSYGDAPLHLDCLARWPHRERFSRGYFDRWDKDDSILARGGNPSEGRAWLLRCGPAKPEADPYYAEVLLSDWPMRLYSRWEQWTAFCANQYGQGLTGESLEATDQVMSAVRQLAPDLEALRALRQRVLFTAH